LCSRRDITTYHVLEFRFLPSPHFLDESKYSRVSIQQVTSLALLPSLDLIHTIFDRVECVHVVNVDDLLLRTSNDPLRALVGESWVVAGRQVDHPPCNNEASSDATAAIRDEKDVTSRVVVELLDNVFTLVLFYCAVES
jgi:hypothetical protein